ncbi:hypothetical protein TNCV_3618781 [Trichonephila clavipes]|nr:hypothetical protein TNCV_3618781 [Trichonephila clavipes]
MTKSVVRLATIVGYNCCDTPRHTIKEAMDVSLRGVAVKSNTTPNHDTGCWSSVAMHYATVQQSLNTVSPNSNASIVMLQAKTGFVIKHNVIQFRCPCPSFIKPLTAQMPVVFSQEQLMPCGYSTML